MTESQKLAFAEVRKITCDRIKNHCGSFTDEMLADKSLFQLVTLLHLLVGHHNYLGTFTGTCRTLEELFGDQLWYREEKPGNIVTEDHEPKPKPVVN
jgi:hypothetical protein